MDAELEPQRMDPIGERFKSRGGKAIVGHQVTAIRVHHEPLRGTLLARVLQVPAFIDHHVLPSERLQVLVEPSYVRLELGLGNGEPIGIPAIPSHRGRGRQVGGCQAGRSGEHDQKGGDGK